MTLETPPSSIILFDGICNLCNAVVQFILKHDSDKKFKFASLQSPLAQEIGAWHSLPNGNLKTIVYIRNGHPYFKSDAVLYILKDMGGVWKLFFLLRALPHFFRDPIYEVVSRHRYRIFGKKDSCMVPAEDMADRFLG